MSSEPNNTNVDKTETSTDPKQGAEDQVDDSKLKLPDVNLKKVEVKVDDNEECLYEVHSKIFIFFKEEVYGGETRTNFWKERGTGNAKLLKNKETGKVRFVMRQDKTGKVIANHFVDPSVTLSANVSSDRSWIFVANDYSDGELKLQQYAIRFKDKKTSDEFKEQYTKAQEINKAK